MKSFVALLALVALVQCNPVVQENETVLKSVIGNFVSCMNNDLTLCLKEKALLVTERVAHLRQLKITEGLTILNNDPEKEGRSYEPLSADIEVRKKQVSERLSERTSRFLENTEIEISFGGVADDDDDKARSIGEARDKKKKEIKKKLKILLPLLAILKAKALAAITLAIIVIAASLFKLAVLAKLAFLAKAFIIIKTLIAKHHMHEEAAWVPHHEEHHGHGGWDGGWSRSRTEGNNLAYSAYNN